MGVTARVAMAKVRAKARMMARAKASKMARARVKTRAKAREAKVRTRAKTRAAIRKVRANMITKIFLFWVAVESSKLRKSQFWRAANMAKTRKLWVATKMARRKNQAKRRKPRWKNAKVTRFAESFWNAK